VTVFAWAGVIAAGLLLLLWIVSALISVIRSEMGRALALALTLVLIGVWGLFGATWLLVVKGN